MSSVPPFPPFVPGQEVPGPVTMPGMMIPLENVMVNVEKGTDGSARLVVGPIAVQFVLPLSAAGAKNVATALEAAASGVVLP